MLLSMLSSAPKDILLIGVVSERIEFGEGLSTTLEQQIQRVEETVIKQLNFRNIEVLQQ
jgi:Ni,Fe-hydrogenase maturation factor